MKAFCGRKIIIENRKTGGKRKKTFKERFFSWPWKPWIKEKFDSCLGELLVQDGQVVEDKVNGSFIMNSKTYNLLLKTQLKSRGTHEPGFCTSKTLTTL